MPFLDSSTDGVPIAFTDQGVGDPTLVFLHGLTGSKANFEAQVDAFSKRQRVITIDFPGSGESGKDRTDWSFATFGMDVVDVVRHLGLTNVVILGHSFASDVTVEAAEHLGDEVRALVWISGYRAFGVQKSEEQIAVWFRPFHQDFEAAVEDLTRRNFGPGADPALVDTVVAAARLCDPQRVFSVLSEKMWNEQRMIDGVAGLDVPVHAINPDYKPSDIASLNAHGVEVTVIPGGHFAMMVDPAAFNETLVDVLAGLNSNDG